MREERDSEKTIHQLDIRNRKHCEATLDRKLTRKEVSCLLDRITTALRTEVQPDTVIWLNHFKKQIRSKHSIELSNQIIQDFVAATAHSPPAKQAHFQTIEREIRSTLDEISRKKHCWGKPAEVRQAQSEKRRRRNHLNSTAAIPHIQSVSHLEDLFIKEQLGLLRDCLEEGEVGRVERAIVRKVRAIDPLQFGKYADQVKTYTVYDHILQRVLALIREDPAHLAIRTRQQGLYRRMKQQMVAILTNEEEVAHCVAALAQPPPLPQKQPKQASKKNYFQLDRDKQDLSAQIEETLEGAKKNLKEAFIKRGRPDYAYEMELALQNRRTPLIKRSRP